MNKQETAKILAVISMYYPNYKPDDKAGTVEAWHAMLEDYSYQQIDAALRVYVRTNKTAFAPAIGQLIGIIDDLQNQGEEMNEGEAWALVHKAICDSAYHAEERFAELPPMIQRAVGSAGQLERWAKDEGYNASVVSSNFMRSYRAVLESEKTRRRLPADIRNRLTNKGQKAIEESMKTKKTE